MKDLNGVEIDFDNEALFPLEFMMPKRNREAPEKIIIEFEKKSEDEEAEDMAKFIDILDPVE